MPYWRAHREVAVIARHGQMNLTGRRPPRSVGVVVAVEQREHEVVVHHREARVVAGDDLIDGDVA